ncbi:MAG: SBBP repeat-containing protein [Verrucomicrobia bacterium]|nr:SBBP repeat-containing protein [Verrucomicrobiota bacterium]
MLLGALPFRTCGVQLDRVSFFTGPEQGTFKPAVDYQGNVVALLNDYPAETNFVRKFGPNGNLLWETSLVWQTPLGVYPRDVATDHQGNILVAGESYRAVGASAGPWAFIEKLSPSGTVLWTNFVGGTNYEMATAIAVDAQNNILVTGTRDWVSDGDNSQRGYVAKFTPNGMRLWVRHFGGTNWTDWGSAVAADSMGNILVAGTTYSFGWVHGGYDVADHRNPDPWASADGFIMKLDPNGNHLWSSYLGGTNSDAATAVVVDDYDNVLVTGGTQSPGWVSGGFRTRYGDDYGGAVGGFLVKLSAGGTHLWSTYLGYASGSDLAVDRYGGIFVTGAAWAPPFWDTDWARLGFDSVLGGGQDAFVEKFTPHGAQAWATYFGGDAGDSGLGIATAPDGSLWTSGLTESTNFVAGRTNAPGSYLARIVEGSYFQGVGNWSNTNLWLLPPLSNTVIILPFTSTLYVDIPSAQAGGFSLDAGSRLQVQPGMSLDVYGPAINHGALAIQNGGTLGLRGTSGLTQSGGTANIDGTLALGSIPGGGAGIAIQDGQLAIGTNGHISFGSLTNGGTGLTQSGGAVDVGGALAFNSITAGGSGIVIQDGQFRVSAGGEVSIGTFSGSGKGLTQTGGSANIDGSLSFGTSGNGARIEIRSGEFRVGAGGHLSLGNVGGLSGLTLVGGRVNLDGTLAVSGGPGSVALSLQGGSLSGSGTIVGMLEATGGSLAPGAGAGSLTVSNDFIQFPGNTLVIEMAGRNPGQYDQLHIGRLAQLMGRLSVQLLDGFAPAVGERFEIVTAGSGVIPAFTAFDLPAGLSMVQSNTSVFLVVTSAIPAQLLGSSVSAGNFSFRFGTVTNRSYTVERTDGFSPANWVFHTNLTGDGTLMEVAVPLTNAPRRFFRVRQP